MASQKWFSIVMVLPLLALCAFTFRVWPGAMPTAGHTNDEQTIRQLNEECLHAHDIADAVFGDLRDG